MLYVENGHRGNLPEPGSLRLHLHLCDISLLDTIDNFTMTLTRAAYFNFKVYVNIPYNLYNLSRQTNCSVIIFLSGLVK